MCQCAVWKRAGMNSWASTVGNATVSASGKLLSQFNEGYINDLVTKIRFEQLSLVSPPRLRATGYLLKTAIYTVPGDIVETGVFTGAKALHCLRS